MFSSYLGDFQERNYPDEPTKFYADFSPGRAAKLTFRGLFSEINSQKSPTPTLLSRKLNDFS